MSRAGPAIYLADTSALFRLFQNDRVATAWDDTIAAGLIAVCPVIELEFLFSARSLADRLDKQRLLREMFGWVPMPDDAWTRALQVQQELTEGGAHRSAGPVDLLIAATAEHAHLTVLSDNADYTTVARVTGQLVRRVAEFG